MGALRDLFFGPGDNAGGDVTELSRWEIGMIESHRRDTGCQATHGSGAPSYRCGDCGKPLTPLF